jgi:hypothetical protein
MMTLPTKNQTRTTTLLVASLLTFHSSVSAQNLQGAVSKDTGVGSAAADTSKPPQKSSNATALRGGVKDDAALQSTLKLVPLSADHARFNLPVSKTGVNQLFPQNLHPDQYAGSTHLTPGEPVNGLTTVTRSTIVRSGVISPISSYTLQPHTTVMWSAPGFEVLPGSTSTDATHHVQSYTNDPLPVSRGGVTTYLPGFQTNTLSTQTVQLYPPSCAGSGLTLWAPGYEIEKINTTVTPPSVVHELNQTSVANRATFTTGYDSYRSVSHDGVVCWKPGYEVSIDFPGETKQTLGGKWSTTSTVEELHAAPGKLTNVAGGEHAQVLTMPNPLAASAHLLPGLQLVCVVPNWKQWYSRYADDILSRWQSVDVGPGVAKVRVIVQKNRDVSCEVVDFTPVAARNVEQETEFRETAVNCVKSVNKFEIPQFPASSDLQEVSFDLNMRRTVETQPQIDVAAHK